MKLIKLKEDHYIIVDDSEIKEGDWFLNTVQRNVYCNNIPNYDVNKDYLKKITHSTVPIEKSEESQPCWGNWANLCYKKIKPLSIKEVKELIGEVDVEKKFQDILNSETPQERDELLLDATKHGFKYGYNQALEDNKRYTEEDVLGAMEVGFELGRSFDDDNPNIGLAWLVQQKDNFIQSLQPKTEWEVEFIDGKLKLKS